MALRLFTRTIPNFTFRRNSPTFSLSTLNDPDTNANANANNDYSPPCTFFTTGKSGLPAFEPSNDADLISQTLLNHNNPFHDTESSLQLNALVLTPSLVHQILLRLHHSSEIALAFFHYCSSHHPYYFHTTTAFNILIDIICKVRQFEVAWQLILQMDQAQNADSKPNFTTFAVLILRLISAGLTRHAIRTFKEMHMFLDDEEKGLNSDFSEDQFCFLLDTLCKYRHVNVAAEVFNIEKSRFGAGNAKMYTIMIYGWCKMKRIGMARQFLNEMVDNEIEPDVVTYNILLNGICRRSSLHPDERYEKVIREAEQLLDEMHKRNVEPDVTSYSILLHVYSRAHKPVLSLEKLKMMKDKGIYPTIATYTLVVNCLCSCGRVEDAEILLDEMVSNGVSPSAATYNCFFKEYIGRKDVQSAMNLYKKMKEGGVMCLPSMHTYNTLLRMLLMFNKRGLAMEVWQDMKDTGNMPDLDSYTTMIHGFCEKQKCGKACELFVEMIDKGYLPQKVTFETLYRGLIQSDMLSTWQRLKKKLDEESITFGSEFAQYHHIEHEDDDIN